VIEIRCFPLPRTRSPDRSCRWLAWAIVGDVRIRAKSPNGAPNELARRLIERGVDPEQPVQITYRGLPGRMRYATLAEAAKWTFKENARRPLHRAAYTDLSDRFDFLPVNADSCIEGESPVSPDPTAGFGPENRVSTSGPELEAA